MSNRLAYLFLRAIVFDKSDRRQTRGGRIRPCELHRGSPSVYSRRRFPAGEASALLMAPRSKATQDKLLSMRESSRPASALPKCHDPVRADLSPDSRGALFRTRTPPASFICWINAFDTRRPQSRRKDRVVIARSRHCRCAQATRLIALQPGHLQLQQIALARHAVKHLHLIGTARYGTRQPLCQRRASF